MEPTDGRPTDVRPAHVGDLRDDVLAGRHGADPAAQVATSVFWLHHGTRLAGGAVTYLNQYVVIRVRDVFGASAFRSGTLGPEICEGASGRSVADLLGPEWPEPVRIAALDAHLAASRPHRDAVSSGEAEPVTLPRGTPEVRATARDEAIAGLLQPGAGDQVALIGVVDPLVAAIRERGAQCLPCDLDLGTTRWGDPITADMTEILELADAVVATGMTLATATFDTILGRCRERGVPLVVYAQTGSAIARAFLGAGVTALSAEPFPFSQFSADPTVLYRYRDAGEVRR